MQGRGKEDSCMMTSVCSKVKIYPFDDFLENIMDCQRAQMHSFIILYFTISALIQKTYILINHTLTQEIYTILVNTVVF